MVRAFQIYFFSSNNFLAFAGSAGGHRRGSFLIAVNVVALSARTFGNGWFGMDDATIFLRSALFWQSVR